MRVREERSSHCRVNIMKNDGLREKVNVQK
jgi:hypothetical protein